MPTGYHRRFELDEVHGICARPGCGRPFKAHQRGQKYCTSGCKSKEADKRKLQKRLDRIIQAVKKSLGIKD